MNTPPDIDDVVRLWRESPELVGYWVGWETTVFEQGYRLSFQEATEAAAAALERMSLKFWPRVPRKESPWRFIMRRLRSLFAVLVLLTIAATPALAIRDTGDGATSGSARGFHAVINPRLIPNGEMELWPGWGGITITWTYWPPQHMGIEMHHAGAAPARTVTR